MPKREERSRLQAFTHRWQPARGAGQRLLQVGPVLGGGRALVEGHDDVGAERLLDVDGALGGEEQVAPVQVGLEGGALLGDFALLRQAEHLEAAAVGEHGAVPGDEAVQAAQLPHQLLSGRSMRW
jgi:hypothetical protein